jgi:dipeptide/tripeptide permease
MSGIDEEEDTNQQLNDSKQALRVLPIMAMFPVFWMLYDQQQFCVDFAGNTLNCMDWRQNNSLLLTQWR